MPWSTRSTTPWATSARPWSIPSRSLARSTDQMASLRELVKEMESGAAELLVILGGNPAYTAPADLDFARALAQGPACDPPRAVRGRDLGPLPLAHPRGPRLRVVGRRPGLRRHGDDPAAADRPPLRRRVRLRTALALLEDAGRSGLRHRPRLLARPEARRRRLRGGLGDGAPRRGDRGDGRSPPSRSP